MTFEQWQHTAKIGEDDVSAQGKRQAVGEVIEKIDIVSTTCSSGNFTSHLNDLTRLDGVDLSGTKLTREHRKETWPRADFHNHRSLANGFTQGLSVSVYANAIREHGAIAAQAIHIVTRASMTRSTQWVPSPVSHR
jgi:hypothetical protein